MNFNTYIKLIISSAILIITMNLQVEYLSDRDDDYHKVANFICIDKFDLC